MSGKARNYFAPIPARAIGDQRLSALHFRALAAIAAHDRFATAQGCWAGDQRLAQLTGCHVKRIPPTVRDLRNWGYVDQSLMPTDRRKRLLRVLYTDEDLAALKGNQLVTATGEIGNQLDPESVTNWVQIGNIANLQRIETSEEFGPEYIKEDNNKNIARSASERHSAEAGKDNKLGVERHCAEARLQESKGADVQQPAWSAADIAASAARLGIARK